MGATVAVGGGGAVVGATVDAGVLAGGAVVAGAAVEGGVVVVGAGVGVLERMLIVALALEDAEPLAEVLAEAVALGEIAACRPKKTTPISSSVSRLPATAASARSIHRGPRRRGGMIFVVSPGMPYGAATRMPNDR